MGCGWRGVDEAFWIHASESPMPPEPLAMAAPHPLGFPESTLAPGRLGAGAGAGAQRGIPQTTDCAPKEKAQQHG